MVRSTDDCFVLAHASPLDTQCNAHKLFNFLILFCGLSYGFNQSAPKFIVIVGGSCIVGRSPPVLSHTHNLDVCFGEHAHTRINKNYSNPTETDPFD